MQFTTQKAQRSFRSSFKKHLPAKFRSQSNSTSFDSSISSGDDVLSVESISSMNQKLSKREKFKSFFSHSPRNTDATFANSSATDSNDSASIQSISSQGKTLSKKEKFKSFFSHSRKSAASASDSFIGSDSDSSSVMSSTAHGQSSSKREKFKSFFSHSKPGPVNYSFDPSNTSYESSSSTSSIETQNKLSTRREKISPYLASTMAQENASSDSSTVIDEETVNAETSFQQKPKSNVKEKIRTVFGYRQPYTKVYIVSPEKTKSTNVTKTKNTPKQASQSATIDAPYPIRMTERELKISRRKRKLLIGSKWLASTAAAIAAVIIIASTPLLPLTLPVSIVFSAVLLYMVYKNARRFWDCWKQSIHRSKFAIKERYAHWKALVKDFFGFPPEQAVDLFNADKNDTKAGKIYPRSPSETPAQYCARNSLPEYDLTFDEWAYSVYSRTVHADSKRIVINAVDVFLTDEQFLKKNRHVSFADPIISMTVQPAVY